MWTHHWSSVGSSPAEVTSKNSDCWVSYSFAASSDAKFKSSQNSYADLKAVMQRPAMRQWGALLDLGLLHMRMASKNGELMRRGACAASYLSVAMRPPPLFTYFYCIFLQETSAACVK